MPELPEVETVVKSIRPRLMGKTIDCISPCNDYINVFAPQLALTLQTKSAGQQITDIYRRAKYIIIVLESGFLTIHLRMTGRLLFSLSDDDKPKHITAKFIFTDGSELYFKDYRKFGRIHYHDSLTNLENKLGPEPLDDTFSSINFYQSLHKYKRQIKGLLLDQSFIAGVGNIYADEALWAARIHPETHSNSISRIKSNRLYQALRSILSKAIEQQGTTIINFYFGEGSKGNFRDALNVFDRHGQECHRCGTTIKKIKVSQRGTHICPKCQKKKSPDKSGLI